MKNIFYLLVLIGFVACSSESKYEKTIADHVQTDKDGTKYDMKFKALEISEVARYTVADSVTIIKDAFDADKAKRIARLEESVKSTEEYLEKKKNGRFTSKIVMEFYEKSIARDRQWLDSLKATTPTEIQKYENRKPDELLAIIVRCKFSIVPPIIQTTAEETFDFTLSPDGTKCYGQKRVKN